MREGINFFSQDTVAIFRQSWVGAAVGGGAAV